MRLARIGIAFALTGAIVACADLFHSTDSPNLCDVDATAPGCITTSDAGVEICGADHAAAEKRALHACAWLAACENPVGKNATGECLVEALQAYDCQANPNRRPKLDAKTFWTKLATVTSCSDVDKAVLKDGVGTCTGIGSGYIGCSPAGNVASRLQCAASGQRYYGENCILQGKTCDSLPAPDDGGLGNNGALCLGDKRRACSQSGCNGAHLAACDDAGLDRGLDCSQFGTGECVATGAQPACKPEGAACVATSDITCTSGGVAESCASGFKESVDCTYISGALTDNCIAIPNAPLGTPAAAACRRSAGCSVDTCNAGKLVACVAGRGVPIDCSADGLKPCNDALSTLEGTRAACTKP